MEFMQDVYSILFCSLVKTEYRELLCAQLDNAIGTEQAKASEAVAAYKKSSTGLHR